jgi:hypothetical protein
LTERSTVCFQEIREFEPMSAVGRIAVAKCVMSVQKIPQSLVGEVVGRESVLVNYMIYFNALCGIFNFLPLRQPVLGLAPVTR